MSFLKNLPFSTWCFIENINPGVQNAIQKLEESLKRHADTIMNLDRQEVETPDNSETSVTYDDTESKLESFDAEGAVPVVAVAPENEKPVIGYSS